MKDAVYCSNGNCPFGDCKKHLKNLAERNIKERICVADFDGVCRRYIGWLVEKETRKNI